MWWGEIKTRIVRSLIRTCNNSKESIDLVERIAKISRLQCVYVSFSFLDDNLIKKSIKKESLFLQQKIQFQNDNMH